MKLKVFNRAVVIGAIVWAIVMVPVGLLFIGSLMFPAFATLPSSADMEARNQNLMLIPLVALGLSILISGVAARASASRIISFETLTSHPNTWSRLGFYVASGTLVPLLGTLPLWWRFFIEPMFFLLVLGVLGLTGAVGGALAFFLSRGTAKSPAPRGRVGATYQAPEQQ